jgi:ankyrin repeat protein
MRDASTTRRLLAPAATLLRLAALASLAFISAAGVARAKDRCAETAQAVQALHEGDRYQAATLLFAAARLGCEVQARALLDRGAAIDAKDREGKTALAKAAEADKLPLLKLLLERGADVNVRAVDGSTPLFYAAEQDRGAAVALLLERGADPNLPGRSGIRPLAAASFNGSTENDEALMKFGADPNALDKDGSGAIVYAAGHGYASVVALLLQAGVDVNRRYAHGLTALMWAAGHDASAGVDDVDATIKTLIEHGAALDLKDDRGKTAADIARDLGHEQAAKLLER